ncbi:MAG: hypothetical protein LUG60_04600 [Erysipelotrichaceae bacterium]|nr:hypothetical protein [Erysipelotrichaceae bacterium]
MVLFDKPSFALLLRNFDIVGMSRVSMGCCFRNGSIYTLPMFSYLS